MQESQQEPPPVPPKMSFKRRMSLLIKVLKEGRTLWRARLEGPQAESAEETLKTRLRSLGATGEGLEYIKAFIDAWRKMRRDNEAFHTLDRYLVGGVGILDLVLFQMLVSVGHPDFASSLAWLAFVISLLCAMGSLFMSFLKKVNEITHYGKVHGTMSLLAEFSTLVSVAALICHIWLYAGLLFIFIAIIVAILCFFYATLVFLGKHFQTPKPDENAEEPVAPISAETKPADTELVQDNEIINTSD